MTFYPKKVINLATFQLINLLTYQFINVISASRLN
jgi:hypothetical protein